MLVLLSRRPRGERGFTLVELMMTLMIGLVIVLSSLSVLDTATRNSDQVQRRSEAIVQGRMAMDELVRVLRSQVCVQTNESTVLPPISAASATSVTVYSDFGDGSGVADRHTIALGADGRLTDTVVQGSGSYTATTFTATPRTRVIATNLTQSGSTPVFQYFGFNTATPPAADDPLNSAASPTVPTAKVGGIARIVLTLRANSEGGTSDKLATKKLTDQVFVRIADPDSSSPSPRCT